MSTLGKTSLLAAVATIATLAVLAAWFQAFAFFTTYDDEGYMMLSVRHLLNGRRLYDEIQVYYGPLYYLEKMTIHGLLGIPLTHTAVRVTALCTRLTTALVMAATAARLTRSGRLAMLTFFAVNLHLFRLMFEPGHPQELAVLLVAGLTLVATFADRHPAATVFALGVLTAAILMVKVNVGVFSALAVGSALVASMPASRPTRYLRTVALLAALSLPWIVVRGHPDWTGFAVTVCASVVALAPWGFGADDGQLGRVHGWMFVLTAVTTVLALTIFALLQGATIAAMLDMLLVRPQHLATDFLFRVRVSREAWAATAAGAFGSIAWAAVTTRRASLLRRPWVALAWTLPLAAYTLLCLGRWTTLPVSSVVAPFAWVILLPGPDGARSWAARLPRLILAWLTVVQPLQAFPVPYTQVVCGAVPALLCGMVMLGDAVVAAGHAVGTTARPHVLSIARGLLVAVALVGSWRMFATSHDLYDAGESLDLPGTGPLHVTKGTAGVTRDVVELIRKRCAVLLTVPGFHSLNFWADRWPPTTDLIPHEFRLLPDERVNAIAAVLPDIPAACLLRGPSISPIRTPDPRLQASIMPLFHPERAWGPATLYVR